MSVRFLRQSCILPDLEHYSVTLDDLDLLILPPPLYLPNAGGVGGAGLVHHTTVQVLFLQRTRQLSGTQHWGEGGAEATAVPQVRAQPSLSSEFQTGQDHMVRPWRKAFGDRVSHSLGWP